MGFVQSYNSHINIIKRTVILHATLMVYLTYLINIIEGSDTCENLLSYHVISCLTDMAKRCDTAMFMKRHHDGIDAVYQQYGDRNVVVL